MNYTRGSVAERFSTKVGLPDEKGCLPWLAGKDDNGYGRLRNEDGYPELAHRVAWRLAGKVFTPGLELLHGCNNPSCVNVDHLREGTHQENMDDAVIAGVMGRPSRLTVFDYETVVDLKAAGWLQKDIARYIGCSPAMIVKILKGDIVRWQN